MGKFWRISSPESSPFYLAPISSLAASTLLTSATLLTTTSRQTFPTTSTGLEESEELELSSHRVIKTKNQNENWIKANFKESLVPLQYKFLKSLYYYDKANVTLTNKHLLLTILSCVLVLTYLHVQHLHRHFNVLGHVTSLVCGRMSIEVVQRIERSVRTNSEIPDVDSNIVQILRKRHEHKETEDDRESETADDDNDLQKY